MGKETEKPTSFLISAEGSCVPELTNLRKSIHCFWALDYSEAAFMTGPELMCK